MCVYVYMCVCMYVCMCTNACHHKGPRSSDKVAKFSSLKFYNQDGNLQLAVLINTCIFMYICIMYVEMYATLHFTRIPPGAREM